MRPLPHPDDVKAVRAANLPKLLGAARSVQAAISAAQARKEPK